MRESQWWREQQRRGSLVRLESNVVQSLRENSTGILKRRHFSWRPKTHEAWERSRRSCTLTLCDKDTSAWRGGGLLRFHSWPVQFGYKEPQGSPPHLLLRWEATDLEENVTFHKAGSAPSLHLISFNWFILASPTVGETSREAQATQGAGLGLFPTTSAPVPPAQPRKMEKFPRLFRDGRWPVFRKLPPLFSLPSKMSSFFYFKDDYKSFWSFPSLQEAVRFRTWLSSGAVSHLPALRKPVGKVGYLPHTIYSFPFHAYLLRQMLMEEIN